MSSLSELISHSKFAAAGRRGGGDLSMELGKKVNHFTFFSIKMLFLFLIFTVERPSFYEFIP
jgi:hypothetical protein